jgi:two-component sensor histidine kinase
VTGQNIRLPASQATPAALVVNELLLNALEHGLKDRAQGIIAVNLVDLGDAVRLEISDDGSGLPPDFQPALSSSLGLQIVRTLVADDLKGTLTFESGGAAPNGDENMGHDGAEMPALATGTRAIVVFPKRPVYAD